MVWPNLESVSSEVVGPFGCVTVSGWLAWEQTVWICMVNTDSVNELGSQFLPWCFQLLASLDRRAAQGYWLPPLCRAVLQKVFRIRCELLSFVDSWLLTVLVRRVVAVTLGDVIHALRVAAKGWRKLLPQHGKVAHLCYLDHVGEL